MKKLLVILGIAILFACEKEDCYVCTVQKAKHMDVWSEWYQEWEETHDWDNDGIETFCGGAPSNKHHTRYDCAPL